ncbi:MAG: carboxylating nicotinate-nucleotide diphosphorylase, partial [Thermoplasmata archaeon]
ESIEIILLKKDGQKIKPSQKVALIRGNAHHILSAERTALNFLCHLSGISTLVSLYRRKIPSKITLLDTRKTHPGLRILEKYATFIGGAKNHRFNLSDGILIKENHINILKNLYKKDYLEKLTQILKNIKRKYKQIIIEAHSPEEAMDFLNLPVDIIMLDNLSQEQIKKIFHVKKTKKSKIKLEISGGINLENLKNIKNLPIQRISIGRLTYGASFLDFSLEVEKIL